MSDTQHSPAAESARENEAIDLIELFAILLQYRKFIIITTFVVGILALGAMIVTKFMPADVSPLPDVYTSSAVLLLNGDQSGGLSSALGGQLSSLASLAGVNTSAGGYGPLMVDIAKSNTIVDTVAEEFGVYDQVVEDGSNFPRTASRAFIRERLSVEHDETLNTVHVRFTHWDPSTAELIANRIVELLDVRFASIGTNRSLTEKQLLERKLSEVSLEMARIEALIRDFQTRYGVLTVEQLATEQITALATARSQLILKELEIDTYSQFARIDDPVLSRLRAEKQNLEDLIRQLEVGGSTQYSTRQASQVDLPELALEFARLERDMLVQTEIYKILTQQYELAKLQSEGQGPIFQVLELAETPEKDDGPSRVLIIVIAGVAGFFLSVIAAFIIHGIRNMRKDPSRVELIRKGLRGEL